MNNDRNQQNEWNQQSILTISKQQQKGLMIQSFKHNRNNNNGNISQIAIKKKSFRQSIRKQYLSNYFEKKREDFFGWIPSSSMKQNHNRFDIDEIQIDKDQPILSQQRKNQKQQTNPAYNDNYFKNVILLQKLISCRQQQEMGYEQRQNNFRYNSFYEFIVDIIRQSLDRRYFDRFNDERIFIKHFDALKNIIYKKLLQQVEAFLIELQDYNKSSNKQNTWAYQKMCFDTYIKLILQIQKFIQFGNLISQKTDNGQQQRDIRQNNIYKEQDLSKQYCKLNNNQKDILYQYDILTQQNKKTQYCKQPQQQQQNNNNNRWPSINIQQQLIYLIKILIQITYYDDNEQLQQINSQQYQLNDNYYDNYYDHYKLLTNKYNHLFQQQSYQNQTISITSILLKYTPLLKRLKFIIVFGIEQGYQYNKNNNKVYDIQSQQLQVQMRVKQDKQVRFSIYKQRRRRQQIILMILILLRNISINIGSDILFEQGIISQIKCILRQSYFKVNIRDKQINIRNKQGNIRNKQINIRNKYQLLKNNNYYNKNINSKQLYNYKIQLFLVDIFQLIRQQKSQQYLTQLDTFAFVFQQLTNLISIINNLKLKQQQQKYLSQYQYLNNNDILFIQQNHYQYHYHSDQQKNQNYQQQNISKQIYSNHLNYLIQRCISCLQFHLLIKQYYIKNNSNTQIDIDNTHNIFNYNHFQHYLSSKKYIHKFSNNNPYAVKFKSLLFGQNIIQSFQSPSCQSLIQKLPL